MESAACLRYGIATKLRMESATGGMSSQRERVQPLADQQKGLDTKPRALKDSFNKIANTEKAS